MTVIFGGSGGRREIVGRVVAGAVRLLGVSTIISVNLAVPEPNPAKDVVSRASTSGRLITW